MQTCGYVSGVMLYYMAHSPQSMQELGEFLLGVRQTKAEWLC